MIDLKELNNVSNIDDLTIATILQNLEDNQQVECHLPGGGYLQINEKLPYLFVYRIANPVDPATVRLILSESSYLIIGTKDFDGYSNLIWALADKMSSIFKSYLLFEFYTSNKGNNTFKIKGPAERLPSTMKVLKEEILSINKKFDFLNLEVEVENTAERHKEGTPPLLSISEAKESGSLVLGLEIPPIYKNEEGLEYPVFFRSFRKELLRAFHTAIYDYIRVQTTSGVKSYISLGRKKLQKTVFEIDKELTKIERSFKFLWLVSPANIRQIKNTFFESNYQKIINYHYRLLPIDPDILKRRLYNLKIEEIDDPAISHIFNEKRDELDQQISMLNERGSKNFFYNSIRLYKGVEPELLKEALNIVNTLSEETEEENASTYLDAKDLKKLVVQEFNFYKKQNPNFESQVHIREDVNILMVAFGELYIPSDAKFTSAEAKAMVQHEVGTHILTHFNGMQQPLEQLAIGLADYDTLQEGISVLSEYMVNGLTINRMRLLAGRVLACHALINGANFQEIFKDLHENFGFGPHAAFNITSRVMQGSGFIKDVIYLRGIVQLRDYLQKGGELEPLFIGKYALKHTRVIDELKNRKVLKEATILPSYFKSEESKKKLKKIQEGLPLTEMIRK